MRSTCRGCAKGCTRMPTCSSCQVDLPLSAFASTQLKKQDKPLQPRCRSCMSNAEAMEASVADAADFVRCCHPAAGPALAEAFTRPAMKTAPLDYASIEEAEAAGWTFNAGLGRWDLPVDLLASCREKELIAKALNDDSKLDAMSVSELRAAIEELSSESAPAGDKATLRRRAKQLATLVAQRARSIRKHNLTFGSEMKLPVRACRACGKLDEGTGKSALQKCSRCLCAWYCGRACQQRHWPDHKAQCKINAKRRAEVKESGTDDSKVNDVIAWYSSVPNLVDSIARVAWEQRKESPLIKVQGGTNARLASISCIPRKVWQGWDYVKDWGVQQYAQRDFDPERHFFAIISAGHPGSENWPKISLRLRFPVPPHEMDAYLASMRARREQKEHHRTTNPRQNPWVMLTGLRREDLNGKQGIRGAWNEEKKRYAVQLTDGSNVLVRPENLLTAVNPVGENITVGECFPAPSPSTTPQRKNTATSCRRIAGRNWRAWLL